MTMRAITLTMSININFVAQSISRGTLYRSRLPGSSSRLHHTLNNLAGGPRTKLLYIGEDISYALYENSHLDVVTWFDDFDATKLDHTILKPEYNLIIGKQDVFRYDVINGLKDKFAKKTILATVHAKHHDPRHMERALVRSEDIRVVSKTTVYDRNNADGWGEGITIYDVSPRVPIDAPSD
ncbi:hypothetical protein ATCVMN08101_683L [Acanthocystis turfacea Chlorella virus MN0810.1]|nr:hypothetical protein ATCVMN08101_683L [Acanthocystis turfacea Chlorella virus MN0810.1]